MSVEVGTLFGHYKVVAMLGQGGMGAVYKARDTRLDRTVAIKVLQEPRADRRQRFVREAKAIASLQHPHICILHDVGSQDAVDYLVMEHVDGAILETPLALPRVIEYGIQIAGALDAAHAKNITHRDLKPANIMVTKSGVKVLDFSIASVSGEGTLTADGVAIGTPAYMAPEQCAGRATDARTDIYALGLVLVEMTTGRNDPRQTIEPPALDRIVRGCLAEQPDDRWQSARDVRRLLQEIDLAPAPVVATRRGPWLVAIATAAVVAAAAAWLLKPAQPSPTYQLSIAPPRGSAFLMARNREGGLALSPDGTMIAFVARTGARVELWTRRLDSGEARPIPGTDRAFYPFWSPDSRQIAFYTPDSLKRVPLDGGPVRTIATSEPRRVAGGAWMAGDVLLVTGRPGGGIHRASLHGGDPQRVDGRGAWPHPLPDGRGFLYTTAAGIYAGSIDGAGTGRRLLEVEPTQVVYSDGHLLFVRNRLLVAQPFDPKSGQVSGESFPVAHSLLMRQPAEVTHDVSFSATPGGALAYATGETSGRLRWRDRSGRTLGEIGDPGEYVTPRVSPDGRRVAFAKRDSGNMDLWVASADGTGIVRLTFDPIIDWYPIWSPDGQTITYSSGPVSSATSPTFSGEALDLFRKAADGTGRAEQLTFDKGPQHSMDWSSDGRFLSFTRNSPEFCTDLKILPAFNQAKPYEFLRTVVSEAHSQFDPGRPARWLAFSSDESGRREIYVAAFVPGEPAAQARWQVSSDGGTFPRWRRDGKELFYWGLDGRIMAVAVDGSGSAFRSSTPVALFQVQPPTLRTTGIEYDATPDGQRFLLIEPAEQTTFQSLSLITNWRAAAARNR